MSSNKQPTTLKSKSLLMIMSAISINLVIALVLIIFFNKINQTQLIILLITFLFLTLFILLWSIIFYKELKYKYEQQIQDQDKLTNVLEIKQLFISIMNHDLNHPLTIIKLATTVLKEQNHSRETTKHLNKIEESVDSALQLINDAHTFSQLEDKHYQKQKIEINLTSLFDKIIDNFQNKKYKNIKIEINFSCLKKPCHIEALSIIENAFINIIDNAIKYSGKTVIININIIEKKNIYIISFADNGIGIPDEYKEKIFLRYERLNKSGIAGTGLGLSIVKHIVELHYGKVWVENNEDKGSIFIIQLPKK